MSQGMYYLIAFVLSLVFPFKSCAFEKDLQQQTLQFIKNKGIPGAALGVYVNGEEHFFQFGYADLASKQPITPDTIFEIASITKVFTSTAIAIEALQNRLRLEDSIATYLPQLNRKRPIAKVNLIQLATHTSGLPRVPPPLGFRQRYNQQKVLEFLNQWNPSSPIGTTYLYSNLGFGLLGYVLQKRENLSFEQVIKRLILNPLQMNSTFVQVPRNRDLDYAQGYTKNGRIAPRYAQNAWPGGGALRSTSRDLLKFLRAQLGEFGPKNVIEAAALTQEAYFKVNAHLTMGLGWQRFTTKSGHLIIDKNGGVEGFSSYIGFNPKKKFGVVILINKGKAQATELGRELLDHLQSLN